MCQLVALTLIFINYNYIIFYDTLSFEKRITNDLYHFTMGLGLVVNSLVPFKEVLSLKSYILQTFHLKP